MNTATEAKRNKLPLKVIMSYWRSRLNRILRQNVLLRQIMIRGKRLAFEMQTWEEYWHGAFPRTPLMLNRLHEAWCAHRANDFHKSSGRIFGALYMEAIREAIKNKWSSDAKRRLLSLENTIVCRTDSEQPLAAMTANFRNPIILLRQTENDEGSQHGETLLLPLLVAGCDDDPKLFFHYRRQSLLRNTSDALLFFPRVDLAVRGDSFRILQELVEVLVHEWDSRIEQRASLLSDKVISPLLSGMEKRAKPIKILDVGSGVGLFTSRLLKRLCQCGNGESRLFGLTLLDQLPVNPEKHFREHVLNKSIMAFNYVNSDFAEGVQRLATRQTRQPAFDLVWLLRILHNISNFNVTTATMSDEGRSTIGRYGAVPGMSDYFRLLAQVFPDTVKGDAAPSGGKNLCWIAERNFNCDTLVLPNGNSLIEAVTKIGRVAIIEDGDLTPEILEQHRESFKLDNVVIHDLSRHLRLSTNHVYVVSRKSMDAHLGGGAAWLN